MRKQGLPRLYKSPKFDICGGHDRADHVVGDQHVCALGRDEMSAGFGHSCCKPLPGDSSKALDNRCCCSKTKVYCAMVAGIRRKVGVE